MTLRNEHNVKTHFTQMVIKMIHLLTKSNDDDGERKKRTELLLNKFTSFSVCVQWTYSNESERMRESATTGHNSFTWTEISI